MSSTKIVRYSTTPERADENQRLIETVFAELTDSPPPGLRYAAFRLDDRVSFVHVAILDDDTNPLNTSAAFAHFQAGLSERCATAPQVDDATAIASLGWISEYGANQSTS